MHERWRRALLVGFLTATVFATLPVLTHAQSNPSGGAPLTTQPTSSTRSATTTTTSAVTTSSATTTTTTAAAPQTDSGGAQLGDSTTTVSTTTTTSTAAPHSQPASAITADGGAAIDGPIATVPVYTVLWTCTSDCRLAEHRDPSTGSRVIAHIDDGAQVTIVCQTVGSLVREPGESSRTWDRLTNGRWISDLFVTTSASGLPTCLRATADVP